MTAAAFTLGGNVMDGLPAEIMTLDLDAPSDRVDACLLSLAELDRARRFVFERDRRRFVRGRAFLRRCLGSALDDDPARVPLQLTPTGKPFVPGTSLQFNLSHSGNLAVLALSWTHELGIDVELETTDRNMPRDIPLLADRVLTRQERAVLQGLSGTNLLRTFLGFWTAKEAYMKLTGLGLRLDPAEISLKLSGTHPTGYLLPRTTRASLWPAPLPNVPAVCFLASVKIERP